jgi:predicted nucleic acid-binding protein
MAQQTLGTIACAMGAFDEARHRLNEALSTFASIGVRFEVARTHLHITDVLSRLGDGPAIRAQLAAAHTIFTELNVLHWVKRAAQLEDLPTGGSIAPMVCRPWCGLRRWWRPECNERPHCSAR